MVNRNRRISPEFRRLRMELKVYFRLRSDTGPGKGGKKQLQIRLTVDGETEHGYASGVYVRPDQWDSSIQMCKGRSREAAEINAELSKIELDHRDILIELKRRFARGEGPRPTATVVKAEYTQPGSSDPALLDFFPTYYAYVESLGGSEDAKAKKTMDRLRTGEKHLKAFVTYYIAKHKITGRFTLRDVTTAMGKQFHAWLQVVPVTGKRKMSKDSANKYLAVFRDCLEYAIDSDLLSKNPLDKFRPKRGKPKEVYFLGEDHLQKLTEVTTDDPQLRHVLFWVQLMCFTGLDYSDAVPYARNREQYERQTPEGVVIHIKRSKEPRNWCEIPMLAQVEFLFMIHPEGPPDPVLADVNRHLKVVQSLIGFSGRDSEGKPHRLTTKICRKTAGAVFVRKGYPFDIVTKILGHSDVRTTKQHYLSLGALSIEAEMRRVRNMNY